MAAQRWKKSLIHRASNVSVDEWPATAKRVQRDGSNECKRDYGRKSQGCPCLSANNTLSLKKAINHINLLPLPSKSKIILSSQRGKRWNQRLWIYRIQRNIHQIRVNNGLHWWVTQTSPKWRSLGLFDILTMLFLDGWRGWKCLVSSHFMSSCSYLFSLMCTKTNELHARP